MNDVKKLLTRIGAARDAISRKEEQTGLDFMIDGVLMNCAVMLKEQEAVKPKKAPFPDASRSDGSWYFICGACSKPIDPYDKYCRECGKPILWEGRSE